MTTCPSSAALRRLADGEATPDERAALLAHVEACLACFDVLQTTSPTVSFDDGDLAEALRPRGSEPLPPNVARLVERLKNLGPPEGAPVREKDSDLGFLAPFRRDDGKIWLGGYKVLGLLGKGGMGMVFEAEDEKLGRRLALKVMRPDLAARHPMLKARFLKEARAAAKVTNDHIVTIYEVGEDNGVPYLAMQLLRGISLAEPLGSGRPLPPIMALRLGCQIAEGLAAAHAKKVVHRDIKPGNLWLEKLPASGATVPHYRVKILDFGLARSVEEDSRPLTLPGVAVGTPGYMAPEQKRGAVVDHRADLFSLGCVLYQASTGLHPDRAARAIPDGGPPPPRELNPAVPLALSDLILRLLAADPASRPASAQVVAKALRDIIRELSAPRATPVPAPPTVPEFDFEIEPDPPPATFLRRYWPLLVAGLLLAVLGGMVLFVVLKLMSSSP